MELCKSSSTEKIQQLKTESKQTRKNTYAQRILRVGEIETNTFQGKEKITDFFLLFPGEQSILLNELSPAERKQTLANAKVNDNRIRVEMKLDEGQVMVDAILYKIKDGSRFVAWIEQLEAYNQLTFWVYDEKKAILVKKTGLMPELIANMFLEDNVDILPYKGTMIYSFNEDQTINVELLTWMESALENLAVKYTITLIWYGSRFIIKRERINPPETRPVQSQI